MTEYHEKWDELPPSVKDEHRALKSLQEELEAVDWYNQRVAVTVDDELRAVLEHNRDEEIEHAAMLIEWLRRRMAGWQEELHDYLFTSAAIVEVEEGGSGGAENGSSSLGIGSMEGDE
jgi:ferritin-like protein